jgi:hypothetical protein
MFEIVAGVHASSGRARTALEVAERTLPSGEPRTALEDPRVPSAGDRRPFAAGGLAHRSRQKIYSSPAAQDSFLASGDAGAPTR